MFESIIFRPASRFVGPLFLVFFVAVFGVLAGGHAGTASAAQGPWVLPAANLSDPGQDAINPQVSTGPDGTTTAVWGRSDGSNSIIQAATRLPGGKFGPAVNVSDPGQDAIDPQVSTGPGGAATVVWYRFDGSNWIVQAASKPAGGKFGPAVNLSDPGKDATSPQVQTGPDGTATVVWQRTVGVSTLIQTASRPAGGSFDKATVISEPGKNAGDANLDVGPDGTVVAAWSRYNGTNSIVQVASKAPDGKFAPGTDLSAAGGDAYIPKVGIGSDGTTTVAWLRYDDTSFAIVQAASMPAGGSFGPVASLSAPGQDADEPRLSVGSDGVTVVWIRNDGTDWIVQASSAPTGGSFGPAKDLSEPGRDSADPQVSTGRDGTTVAWSRSNGANTIIRAVTKPLGGSFGQVFNLSEPGQNAQHPQVSTGPDGSATVVWTRTDGTNSFAQAASTETFELKVTKAGGGKGAVKSAPAGIDCGKTCQATFGTGTKVTLTATAAKGSIFSGWSGACAGLKPSCEVSVDKASNAVARFDQPSTSIATFDGKFLYIGLKCSARFKPGCEGTAQAVTKKKNGKAMTSRADAAQKAGKWKVLKLKVKPSFKAKIAKMAKRPTKKLLVVKSVVSAKKYKRGKKSTVYHTYRVRSSV